LFRTQRFSLILSLTICLLMLACSGGNNPEEGPDPVDPPIDTTPVFKLTQLGQISPRPEIDGNLPSNGNTSGGIYQGVSAYLAADGKEYGLITSSVGLSIVDVSDPANMMEVQLVELDGGAVHRDVEVYQNYAYVGGQEGSTTSILDLSGLPNAAPIVNIITPSLDFSHTLNIAGDLLYLNSARGECRVYELSNPTNPGLLKVLTGGDCHDSFVRGNLMVSADGWLGVYTLIDISDLDNPVVLGATTYNEDIYAHSAWISEDSTTLYAFEEANSLDVMIYDITDPSNPTLLSTFQMPENTLLHNGALRDGYLFLAYYESGLVVVDVHDPANPVLAAQALTWSAAPTGYFNGGWNVNLSLPSGKILVSDTKSGLFVFRAGVE